MKQYLLKHVSQLFLEMFGGTFLDSFNGLVGLFDHVLGNGIMCLRLVPRTTVALTKAPDGAHQAVKLRMSHRGTKAMPCLCINQIRKSRNTCCAHALLGLTGLIALLGLIDLIGHHSSSGYLKFQSARRLVISSITSAEVPICARAYSSPATARSISANT